MTKQAAAKGKLDTRNYFTVAEVLSLFKILILLCEVNTIIPVSTESDTQLLFVSFDQVSHALLQALGFSSDSHVDSNSIRSNRNHTISQKYPQLLLKALLLVYQFKAKFSHSDELVPVFNLGAIREHSLAL